MSQPTLKAEIVAVGSEMLTPSHIDTNSLYLTERLNELGIDLQGKSIGGDDRGVLKAIVADALRRADLLIVTGGLGPTDDDLTREVVADLIGRSLEFHPDIFERIQMRFTARGLRTPEINRRQAMVPAGAVVLPNLNGTAPGLWIEDGQKLIVLLPGPPRELKPMFETLVLERLRARAGMARLYRRVLRITGQTESSVEEQMQPLYAGWLTAPIRINNTILASLGQIELHLWAVSTSADETQRALDAAVAQAQERLGRDLFSVHGETLQQVVGQLCRARGFKIAAAESCTGGLTMARLTEVPGSSEYVDRGVVVYSNESKTDLLGVPAALIREHGAVSEPVAAAMASGMAERAGTDLAVGITGIAGPGGGTPAKPVGMVVVGAAWRREHEMQTRVRTFQFSGGRDMVRFQASQAALDMVRRWMLE